MPDTSAATPSNPDSPHNALLIVEDDSILGRRLRLSMEEKGYQVTLAGSINEASDSLLTNLPAFAIVDMRLPAGNGLQFMSTLRAKAPDCRAVILTGYGSIPTAVLAIEAGAFDYLAKPADADEIHNALRTKKHDEVLIPFTPASGDRVRREHIDSVFEQFGRNVSETARRLGMHRRTLQRILGKNVPHNH